MRGVWMAVILCVLYSFLQINIKRYTALNPNLKTWKMLSREWELGGGVGNVKLYKKGLWSYDTVLKFDTNNKGPAFRIVSDAYSEAGVNIPVTALDNIVHDETVTLIKMDIEGSELEALKGCARTIKRDRPRLCICVYHKPEDIYVIPLYILSLVPDYKFYIRHHFLLTTAETVLYAI
jgi:FkbM family methyltransferase